MTNYLRRNKKVSARYILLGVLVLLAVFFSSSIRRASLSIFGNIFEVKTMMISGSKQSEVEKMKSDIDRLRMENSLLLAGIVPFERASTSVLVIATPPLLPFDTVLVRGGEEKGIHVGDVVTSGRVLLGVLGKINDSYGTITLLSNPGKTTHASVGKGRVPVELTGLGGGTFKTKVSAGVKIEVGDIVSFDGAPDLVIGVVTALPPSSTPSFQDVAIALPFSLRSLRFVDVIPEHTFPISLSI